MHLWIICSFFFAITSSVAMNVLACDCWGPWSRVSLGLFLGLKVYTFSTCLDNAKLIFQRDSSFPSGPKPQSLLCSSSSSSRPIGKELFATGPERSLSACTAVTPTLGIGGDRLAWATWEISPGGWVGVSGSQASLREPHREEQTVLTQKGQWKPNKCLDSTFCLTYFFSR